MNNKDNMGTQITSVESSVNNLPTAITLNDTIIYPSTRYRGQDATISSWPAWRHGETLTIAGNRFEAIDE